MKLAVIGDEIAQNHETVVDLATKHHFEAVEVRSVWNTPPHRLSQEQCTRITARLAKGGLTVAGFAPPVFKDAMPSDDAGLTAAAETLARSVEIAGWLGSPRIRVFTFYRNGDPDPAAAARLARSVLARVELPPSLELCVETGTRTNTPDAATTVRFLDALADDRLSILWDPGNGVFSGHAHAADLIGEYELLRERIRHIHVKDPAGRTGYVRLGEGAIDWPRLIRRLAADRYAGHLSLETHWRRGRVLTAEQRDQPWGESFSADGAAASEACMAILAGWVRDATAH